MKKKIFIMLMICMSLTGCNEKNVATENNIKVEEDSEILLEYGYEKISDIAYCKIDSTAEKPVCYIEYIQGSPESSFYLMGSLMEQLEYDCDFIVTWNDKQYKFNDYLEEENMEDAFPEEWKEVVENAINGITVDNMVAKKTADKIDEEVKKFCENNKKESKEENEKQIDENSIIAKKESIVDGEKILIFASEDEGDLSLGAYGSAKTEEKASLLLTTIQSTFDELKVDYTIMISYSEFSVVYMKIGDNLLITGTNKDGTSTTSLPDWIVSEIEMSDKESGEYVIEVLTVINEFCEEFSQ